MCLYCVFLSLWENVILIMGIWNPYRKIDFRDTAKAINSIQKMVGITSFRFLLRESLAKNGE